MRSRLATIASDFLKPFGLEIVRRAAHRSGHQMPPPLRGNAAEALTSSRIGASSAFLCPVDDVVMLNGFGFAEQSWHPFSAVLIQYQEGMVRRYEESILCEFYSRWTPRQASAAIIGFDEAPPCLRTAPSHGYHFTPWTAAALEQELRSIEDFYRADYGEHGAEELRLESDGFKYHGPVSQKLGRVEFSRLIQIHASISKHQYDRSFGDVNVYVLRRGDETRFVCRGGVHRVAAMKALGHREVPARLCAPYLVDLVESEGWPQVVNGAWGLEPARRYLNHLFDFSAENWAGTMGRAQGSV